MAKTVLICARLFDGLSDTLTGPTEILIDVWKFERDVSKIEKAQKRIVTSKAPVAYGADCGMFPFSHGILDFQAMVAAGLTPQRALKSAASVAASLLQRDDIGVLASGKQADIIATEGDPVADISATQQVDSAMIAGRIYRHQTFDVFQC